MSLLPNRFQVNDKMPTPCQPVREAIQPEACKYRAFEERKHCVSYDVPGYEVTGKWIEENDCRQIKGAAEAKKQINPVYLKSGQNGAVIFIEKYASLPQVAYSQKFILNTENNLRILEKMMGIRLEPGEWRDCSEDMPDLPAGKFEVRRKDAPRFAWTTPGSLRNYGVPYQSRELP